MIKKVLVVILATFFLVTIAFGQASQAGAINGTVTDPDGVTIPGITVVLKSPALVLPQLTTITNANGTYRFLGLAPGVYELTFMLEGMNTLVRKGIDVHVGRTSTVDVGMTLKSLEENIVVSGKAPTVDRQKTTGVASLDVEVLKMIPTRNRDVMDYFNLTPGVTGDTAHGSGEMDNSYNMDGVNMGDPSTGTDYVSFGMDIMEEVAVQTGGLSAEYGSVKGAVMNVITKSGGNKFSGSLYFYYDHEKLQSDNTKGTDLYVEGGGDKNGRKFQAEPGFTLGGPIVKDKLWFFVNASMKNRESYVSGYPYNEPENIPVDVKEYFPYLKLTYQPTQSDKFIFSYNFSDYRTHHRFADPYQTLDTTAIQETPTHVFNAHWTKTFGANLFANLKLAMVKFDMDLSSKFLGTQYTDYYLGLDSGTYWRNKDYNQRDRYQVVLDATTFIDDLAGSHEVKAGFELQMAKTAWLIEANASDPLGLAWIINYPELVGGNGIYYGYNINSFNRKDEMLNYSFYINDTWNVTNNLTLNLGLRFDYNSIIWPSQNQDEEPQWNPAIEAYVDRRITSDITPLKWKNLSPRLGLIYDIFSDGTTLFKASWSHYVQPNQTGWVNTAHPNGWHYWAEYFGGYDSPLFYFGATTPAGTTVGYGDYELKAPTSNELTVGFERELWEDWGISLRYIKKWEKDLIHIVDASALDIDTLMETGDLVWLGWEEKSIVDPYNGKTVTFYNNLDPSRVPEQYIVNPPGAKRDYDGFELTINKRYSNGWSISASYVYANSRGLIATDRNSQSLGTSNLFNNPNAHINMDGRFPYERRHQLKLNGLVKGPFGINIGGYFRFLSGHRYTRTVTATYLGLSLEQTDETINAEDRGASGYPDIVELDLKVEKAFKIGKVELKIFADIFNVFNSNTVIEEYLDSSNTSIKFGLDERIVDPRVVRLGARIEF